MSGPTGTPSARAALALSFLGSLPVEVQERLADLSTMFDLPSGQPLFDPDLAVVVTGTIRAFVNDASGRQLTVGYLRSPDVVGLARSLGREFPVGYQAVTDTQLLRFGRYEIDELRRTRASLGWAAAEVLAHQLDDVFAETARVAFHSVRERVAYHLVALYRAIDRQPVAIHQSDLAQAVGSVREVVARALGQLHQAGLIEAAPSGIVVLDAEGLEEVAAARS